MTSLKLFGLEVDPQGNTPLKLAVRIGDYESVRSLLKSGCAEPLLKPHLFWPAVGATTFGYNAFELASLIGDEETLKHFCEDEHRRKRHAWK